MSELFFVLSMLLLPLLTAKVNTGRPGLVIGLLLSLVTFGGVHPLLALVPLSNAAWIFWQTRSRFRHVPDAVSVRNPSVRNPALPVLVIFLLTMALFIALSSSFAAYGAYVNLQASHHIASQISCTMALMSGPVFFGIRCDSRGSFYSALLLTLLAELSVFLISVGDAVPLFYMTGRFLLHLCIGGFFVLMPLLTRRVLGEKRFLQVYPLTACGIALVFLLAGQIDQSRWSSATGYGSFLFNLLFLSLTAAFFLFLTWKRRLILIK